jgi:hypothetical protein
MPILTHQALLQELLDPEYKEKLLVLLKNRVSEAELALESITHLVAFDASELDKLHLDLETRQRCLADTEAVFANATEHSELAALLGLPEEYLVYIPHLPPSSAVYRAHLDVDTLQAVLPAFSCLTNLSFQPAHVAK